MNSKAVLDIFKEITTVPRESGHEEKMVKWLKDWASSHSLACKIDKVGNVVIRREAAPGKENVPVIVLQAHMDMVCEKNESCGHDFATDPISYIVEDGWMIAPDTTLGADDGIGIAAALALLSDSVPTGPVECLFTVSEETDMFGAEHLEAGFITGDTLVNLDSEDEGELFIGCSGGLNTNIDFALGKEALKAGYETLLLKVEGGLGGHSGDEINKGRANAVQLLCRFLHSEFARGMQLCGIVGGGKPNAIAREAQALVAVADKKATAGRFEQFGKDIRQEFHVTDPGIGTSVHESEPAEFAYDTALAQRFIAAMFACPHGVQAMSQDIPGLVQTSTNLAAVKPSSNGALTVITSQRSPSRNERISLAHRVAACFELAGGKSEHLLEYPGWEPNPKSAILKRSVQAYRKLFNEEPVVRAIHAGLECGLFLTKFPNLDMVSFGPTLRGVHAPGEKLELASLDRFVMLLEEIVTTFGE